MRIGLDESIYSHTPSQYSSLNLFFLPFSWHMVKSSRERRREKLVSSMLSVRSYYLSVVLLLLDQQLTAAQVQHVLCTVAVCTLAQAAEVRETPRENPRPGFL